MADIYRVWVRALDGRYLTCQVAELYEDSGLYPSRTLVLHLLWDTVDGRTPVLSLMNNGGVAREWAPDFAQSSPLGHALAGRYAYEDGDWNWNNVGRFISCVGVVDPWVGPVENYYHDATGWHHVPRNGLVLQATFHIAATDPQWFAHLVPGMSWISRGYGEDTYAGVHPTWRTTEVVTLAQGIDDEQAFERLPILADALQEAGCDCEDLLNHLRDTTATHVRGCWALDLVLGKE